MRSAPAHSAHVVDSLKAPSWFPRGSARCTRRLRAPNCRQDASSSRPSTPSCSVTQKALRVVQGGRPATGVSAGWALLSDGVSDGAFRDEVAFALGSGMPWGAGSRRRNAAPRERGGQDVKHGAEPQAVVKTPRSKRGDDLWVTTDSEGAGARGCHGHRTPQRTLM